MSRRKKEKELDYILYPEWSVLTHECARSGEDPYRLAASIYHCIRYDDVTIEQINHAKRYYNND